VCGNDNFGVFIVLGLGHVTWCFTFILHEEQF
jgi:hypothetical protein